MKTKILLLSGGPSKERKVSLSSGKAVIKALKNLNYEVVRVDPNYEKKNFKKYKCDLAFNALHGQFGEDGTIQSILEKQKIPYTHSGPKSSLLAMDKVKSKKYFIKNKIMTPKYKIIRKLSDLRNNISKNKFVLKPINEGSSVGVLIFDNLLHSNFSKIKFNLKKYKKLLQEEFIEGKEVQAAVMGDKPIGAIEIQPKRKFYDYEAKYNPKSKTRHIMPANIKKIFIKKFCKLPLKLTNLYYVGELQDQILELLRAIRFFLLEVNTQPGMTNLSLVPEIAEHAGISFEKLVKWIVLDASTKR